MRELMDSELEDLSMEILTYHIQRENNRMAKHNAQTLEEIKHCISRAVFEDVRFSYLAVYFNESFCFREKYMGLTEKKFVKYLNDNNALYEDLESELAIWRNYYDED